jgi:hypothetical protein
MFPESDPGPYLIVETHESVRHCCSWLHPPVAPPLLTTESDAPSTLGRCSFYSVPSDLSGEWEYIKRRDSDSLGFRPRLNSIDNFQPDVDLSTPCHSPTIEMPNPAARLETALLKSDGQRRAMPMSEM